MESASDILDLSHDGDLVFVLMVEGKPHATARAQANVISQMVDQLGMKREEIAAELKDALHRGLANALERVEITRLREDPAGSLRYVAAFVFDDLHNVREGLVWYDVQKGLTGPDEAPEIVRNKLRYEVVDRLVGKAPSVTELRKALG